LAGVDGSALRYHALTMPAGRATMRMTLASQGRSRSALAGALSGSGSLTLESAHIAGLDGKAIDAAIAASDSGQVANDDILRKHVAASLSAGHLDVGSAQIPFNIRDGRLSVAATTLQADGAIAVVSGGYDVTADQTDIRVNLSSLSGEQATGRPAVEVFAVGPSDGLHRTVDVGSLSSWLALRAIDRETRRLDALERSTIRPPVVTPPASPPPAVAMTPPAENAPARDAAPTAAIPGPEVPLPGSDPRRNAPKPKTPASQPAPNPQASNGSSAPRAAPLPPPIEVRPAPSVRPMRPHAPLVIAPPAPIPGRTGF
jgi:large subunit ribosomal protein L24